MSSNTTRLLTFITPFETDSIDCSFDSCARSDDTSPTDGVSEGDDADACVFDENRGDCGDDVASGEVGSVGVLSVCARRGRRKRGRASSAVADTGGEMCGRGVVDFRLFAASASRLSFSLFFPYLTDIEVSRPVVACPSPGHFDILHCCFFPSLLHPPRPSPPSIFPTLAFLMYLRGPCALSAIDETRAKFHCSTPFNSIAGERATIKQTEHGGSESIGKDDEEMAVPTEQTRREDAASGRAPKSHPKQGRGCPASEMAKQAEAQREASETQ
ncbi:hypothetical protein BLNAU_14328 [Blattamonas nauphoetae]|uniref:Uncharacterized protein n=1 Tax=Blattamonas nauphoetae TaxID=2049346 RepID=A0ABQ9XH58_9EUKA|nr:hypothetical protein BLNAU_14328 [Blattamonas nauphoetae]